MSDWYYAADNTQKGPINESELKAHFATNQLPVDTLVWKEGMENWTPANQVPAFSFRQPPAPAKVQPPPVGAAPDAPATAASEPGTNPSSTTPVDVKSLLGKGEALEVEYEDAEKNKVFGILAYIGILFLVPLLAAKDSPFAKYHANQGLVLFLVWIVIAVGLSILNVILLMILPAGLSFIIMILNLVYLGLLVLAVLGIINAAAGKCVPLPVIGGIKLIK
ncbi:MAG TPA: GYF domain-containing protein [Candidatus Methylacidiphilales bacterium]